MKKKILSCCLALLMTLTLSAGIGRCFSVYAADNTVYSNNRMTVVVASSDGNCSFRTGPGLGYDVMSLIYNGTVLQVTGVCRNSADGLVWGLTSYNGTSGWISMMLTIVNDIENASKAIYDVTVTNEDYIYLRQGPGTEYDALTHPTNGQVLRIYETVTNSFDGRPWGRTTVNNYTGWVSLDWTYRAPGT